MPRYRFAAFTLSPRQRLLLRDDRELPLIPRYLDLLIFLVEHRHEAVHRRDIFERVWSDVIVSDSALAQAIRTLRRTLGDDSREPVFIRTISRHGYQFVFPQVEEEADDGRPPAASIDPVPEPESTDAFEPLLERLTRTTTTAAEDEDQREAAERLHQLGTHEALARLGSRPGHTHARAVLRDTRWDVPEAGDVPLLGVPGAFETATALVRLRVRHVARLAASRTIAASSGAAVAGGLAGVIGGVLLALAPGSTAPVAIAAVLGVVGAVCGGWGGAGVGLGISLAEAAARSYRRAALVGGGALGGGVAGSVAQWVGRAALSTLVGLHVAVGGGWEGVVIGGAAGLGVAAATKYAETGFAAPRGRRRLATALWTAAACAVAALLLALSGRSLVGGTIHAIAQASAGSEAALTPLSRMLGEREFGAVTRALIGTGEGAVFGLGLAWGLTRRPAALRR